MCVFYTLQTSDFARFSRQKLFKQVMQQISLEMKNAVERFKFGGVNKHLFGPKAWSVKFSSYFTCCQSISSRLWFLPKVRALTALQEGQVCSWIELLVQTKSVCHHTCKACLLQNKFSQKCRSQRSSG